MKLVFSVLSTGVELLYCVSCDMVRFRQKLFGSGELGILVLSIIRNKIRPFVSVTKHVGLVATTASYDLTLKVNTWLVNTIFL